MPDGTDWPQILDSHEFNLILATGDIDELNDLRSRLSEQLEAVRERLHEIEDGDWTSYRDCVTGALCRSRE